ncbi:uncharacterized protein LOC120075267 [Benincasa hispida]|uniref:uncharacterized protein LOC120075267 n=1 Tax=Benincasa hispida TaxID=102211 RepID=UPI001902259C|nr:uncharacterized protein LOC120075267 [Benincasa hispida]
MPSTESFMRQISRRGEGSRSTSRRWGGEFRRSEGEERVSEGNRWNQKMEGGVNMYGIDNGGMSRRKRVMVVVDNTSQSNHATMWALTHVANKGDVLTLLHVITNSSTDSSSAADSSSSSSSFCANSLGSLCKASRPEVEVEVLVIEGPKLATVINQVKKLEVSVLVVGQRKPSFLSCFCGSGGAGDLVEQCINNVECLTIGVRKQSRDMGGYVINTRWQKNFWLLA